MSNRLLKNISIIFWIVLGFSFVMENHLIKQNWMLLVLMIIAIMIFVVDTLVKIVKIINEIYR